MVPVWDQARLLFLALGLGALLGVLLDGHRAFSYEARLSVVLLYLLDSLFWLLATIAIYLALLLLGEGEIRGFVVLGLLLGAGMYFLLAGRPVLRFWRRLFKGLRKFFRGR